MPFVSFFPFPLVSKATAVCEERSCGPLHSIYGVLAPRSVKADPRSYCPANGSIAHQLQIQTGRRDASYTSISDYLFITNEIRSAFLFFSLPLLCVMDGQRPSIRPTLHHTISNAYKYRASVFNESTEQKHLEQSWRAHPYNHRFFASGIAPGVRHGGLEMRGVTCLQYERCTF